MLMGDARVMTSSTAFMSMTQHADMQQLPPVKLQGLLRLSCTHLKCLDIQHCCSGAAAHLVHGVALRQAGLREASPGARGQIGRRHQVEREGHAVDGGKGAEVLPGRLGDLHLQHALEVVHHDVQPGKPAPEMQ